MVLCDVTCVCRRTEPKYVRSDIYSYKVKSWHCAGLKSRRFSFYFFFTVRHYLRKPLVCAELKTFRLGNVVGTPTWIFKILRILSSGNASTCSTNISLTSMQRREMS